MLWGFCSYIGFIKSVISFEIFFLSSKWCLILLFLTWIQEPIPVTQLVRETAAVMQEFTQSGYAYQYCFIFKKIILIIFSYANLTLWWCDINDMHHQSLVFLISKLYHHDPNHHLKPFPSKWGWLWSTEGHERFTQTISLMLTTCRLVLSSEPRPLAS